MRFIHVSPFFTPHIGGVESHVGIVAAELARRGHQVTVLTSRHRRSLSIVERDSRGFDIVRTPALGTLFSTPIPFGVSKVLRGLSLSADVVHLHYPPPLLSYLAVRALDGMRAPICITYHCDLYLEGQVGRLLTALYQKLFLPPTLAAARRIIVHTEGYGKTSRFLQDLPFVVIPSLVDTEHFRPRGDDRALRLQIGAEGKRIILFVGRLVPHKGVDDLIRALPTLPADVHIVVVGGGPNLVSLKGVARRSGVEQRVLFTGSVSDEDLPRYYAIASLVALPSYNRLEGFGLATIEAMASGRPVLVADMPGVREVVEEGVDGLLVQPLLAKDLATRCGELLADPDRLDSMGRKARENALRKYSISVVVDRLEELYGEIASGSNASLR